MPPSESSPYQLIVEGRDDLHSVVHLLRRHGFDWEDPRTERPYIASRDGIEEVLRIIPVAAKGSYERLGVVLDADSAVADRWHQIRERLRQAGLDAPTVPDPAGTVVGGLRPGSRVGIWLMPDNTSPGRLEDFLARLVPPDDRCWDYADEVTSEARRRGASCKQGDHVKSVIHTWLAWQETPGLPFGVALRAQVFRHDGEDAIKFVRWFRRLFVEE